jgi:integrase
MLQEYKDWQDAQREGCGDQWKPSDGRVFTAEDGGLIHPDSLTKWFKAFIRRHGFPDVHLHSLRHTAASVMIADGIHIVTVSKRLGHAQVSTTSNIYAHMIKSADEKAAQVAEKYADLIEPLEPEKPLAGELRLLKKA